MTRLVGNPEEIPPPPTRERWYLVKAILGRELLAEQQLRNQGFVSFLPKQLKTVRHARRLSVSPRAYFPGYLFVRLNLDRDRWRSVNGTLGVSYLVGRGDRPACAPRGVVEALIEAADDRDIIQGPALTAGQTVRIHAGVFADQLAVIERLDDAGRVRVLLDIVGGQMSVELRREFVAAAV